MTDDLRIPRTGHGSWVILREPAGILWQTDTGRIGFDPAPGADRLPLTETTWAEHTAGQKIYTGLLDNWERDR